MALGSRILSATRSRAELRSRRRFATYRMSSEKPSGVWDLLNKMKERQKAAEQSVVHHRQQGSARRHALDELEAAFSAAAAAGNYDAASVLKQFQEKRHGGVTEVVNNHKKSLGPAPGDEAFRAELVALRRAQKGAVDQLSVARMTLSKALSAAGNCDSQMSALSRDGGGSKKL